LTPADPAPAGRLTRRGALTGLATAGLSLPLLAACADDGDAGGPATDPSATTEPAEPGAESGSEPGGEPVGEPTEEPSPQADGAVALTRTDDVPVGGGVIFTADRVVVTQPRAGDFKCFSAVCTHEGCLVTGVGSTIVCNCHGSSFDLATGEVLGGPAPAPLPAVDFTINKDQVVLS
jgi:Rieske Fe-S protein